MTGGFAQSLGSEGSLRRFLVSLLPLLLHPLGEVAHAARRMVGIQEEELQREEEELKEGFPSQRQIRSPIRAFVIVGRPRGTEGIDDQIGGQTRQQRNARHTRHPRLVEVLQGFSGHLWIKVFGIGLAGRQDTSELKSILNGLAAALTQVGHHWVHCIAHEHHVAIGPRAEELGPPVVEITLLHRLRIRVVQHIEHFARPTFMKAFQITDDICALLGIAAFSGPGVTSLMSSRGQCAKGIPLDASISYIGGDEIPLWPNVDFVAALIVVRHLEHGLAGKDGVPGVAASLD
mmetsp:Transcript_9260/g.11599  ORF Transcript_9260/g.11599 Transcript_9260/m.11599 type:complete len:290 (-) Transcript_9260:460-1329(-)